MMRFFRRAPTSGAERVAERPLRCDFCELAGDPSSFRESLDAVGRPRGYACAGCEKRYAAFAARLARDPAAGRPGWLGADAGTEHLVAAGEASGNAVLAVVEGLADRIETLPRATARIAASRLDVYGGANVARCDALPEAVAAVSGAIAGELARHHRSLREFMAGREWVTYTVSLFGEGAGVLLSRTGRDGDRLAQYCFLVEFDHSVHLCVNWHV
ncbi:hypothetical protein [Streptomyces sp. B6B3]|uniref:hypothetical protein n=1 Tax=Streptomyces sp. B6B3 TaxID=3153570 RepID=UPI00325DE0D4